MAGRYWRVAFETPCFDRTRRSQSMEELVCPVDVKNNICVCSFDRGVPGHPNGTGAISSELVAHFLSLGLGSK